MSEQIRTVLSPGDARIGVVTESELLAWRDKQCAELVIALRLCSYFAWNSVTAGKTPSERIAASRAWDRAQAALSNYGDAQ